MPFSQQQAELVQPLADAAAAVCDAIVREAPGGPGAAALCSAELLGALLTLAVRVLRLCSKAASLLAAQLQAGCTQSAGSPRQPAPDSWQGLGPDLQQPLRGTDELVRACTGAGSCHSPMPDCLPAARPPDSARGDSASPSSAARPEMRPAAAQPSEPPASPCRGASPATCPAGHVCRPPCKPGEPAASASGPGPLESRTPPPGSCSSLRPGLAQQQQISCRSTAGPGHATAGAGPANEVQEQPLQQEATPPCSPAAHTLQPQPPTGSAAAAAGACQDCSPAQRQLPPCSRDPRRQALPSQPAQPELRMPGRQPAAAAASHSPQPLHASSGRDPRPRRPGASMRGRPCAPGPADGVPARAAAQHSAAGSAAAQAEDTAGQQELQRDGGSLRCRPAPQPEAAGKAEPGQHSAIAQQQGASQADPSPPASAQPALRRLSRLSQPGLPGLPLHEADAAAALWGKQRAGCGGPAAAAPPCEATGVRGLLQLCMLAGSSAAPWRRQAAMWMRGACHAAALPGLAPHAPTGDSWLPAPCRWEPITVLSRAVWGWHQLPLGANRLALWHKRA